MIGTARTLNGSLVDLGMRVLLPGRGLNVGSFVEVWKLQRAIWVLSCWSFTCFVIQSVILGCTGKEGDEGMGFPRIPATVFDVKVTLLTAISRNIRQYILIGKGGGGMRSTKKPIPKGSADEQKKFDGIDGLTAIPVGGQSTQHLQNTSSEFTCVCDKFHDSSPCIHDFRSVLLKQSRGLPLRLSVLLLN